MPPVGARPGDTHLLAVLADVGVDLVERAQHVELGGVQARLLGEVGVHVLVADGGQLGNVRVIPAGGQGIRNTEAPNAPRLLGI